MGGLQAGGGERGLAAVKSASVTRRPIDGAPGRTSGDGGLMSEQEVLPRKRDKVALLFSETTRQAPLQSSKHQSRFGASRILTLCVRLGNSRLVNLKLVANIQDVLGNVSRRHHAEVYRIDSSPAGIPCWIVPLNLRVISFYPPRGDPNQISDGYHVLAVVDAVRHNRSNEGQRHASKRGACANPLSSIGHHCSPSALARVA